MLLLPTEQCWFNMFGQHKANLSSGICFLLSSSPIEFKSSSCKASLSPNSAWLMSYTWLSYKLLSLPSNFGVNTQTSLSALDVRVNQLLLMTTRAGRRGKSNIAQTSRLLLHLNFEAQLLIAALSTYIKTCRKLHWHCLISRDCFKPSQRARAPTLFSSVSQRRHSGWLTLLLDAQPVVPAWKKVNIFTVGSKKNFKQVPFCLKKGSPAAVYYLSVYITHVHVEDKVVQ